ncbi:conserved hypothetical protein [Neospora caninum Liverpool]|nr:conserved hypothetical protein [Neospora caninum Liverpool]CBZ55820.1 conserved hypothetical protein [Neospora caninum Liverpool]|eukprot:XP_003885846.1 conserved hypothetical protein [Neospora caninum Liverpool]
MLFLLSPTKPDISPTVSFCISSFSWPPVSYPDEALVAFPGIFAAAAAPASPEPSSSGDTEQVGGFGKKDGKGDQRLGFSAAGQNGDVTQQGLAVYDTPAGRSSPGSVTGQNAEVTISSKDSSSRASRRYADRRLPQEMTFQEWLLSALDSSVDHPPSPRKPGLGDAKKGGRALQASSAGKALSTRRRSVQVKLGQGTAAERQETRPADAADTSQLLKSLKAGLPQGAAQTGSENGDLFGAAAQPEMVIADGWDPEKQATVVHKVEAALEKRVSKLTGDINWLQTQLEGVLGDMQMYREGLHDLRPHRNVEAFEQIALGGPSLPHKALLETLENAVNVLDSRIATFVRTNSTLFESQLREAVDQRLTPLRRDMVDLSFALLNASDSSVALANELVDVSSGVNSTVARNVAEVELLQSRRQAAYEEDVRTEEFRLRNSVEELKQTEQSRINRSSLEEQILSAAVADAVHEMERNGVGVLDISEVYSGSEAKKVLELLFYMLAKQQDPSWEVLPIVFVTAPPAPLPVEPRSVNQLLRTAVAAGRPNNGDTARGAGLDTEPLWVDVTRGMSLLGGEVSDSSESASFEEFEGDHGVTTAAPAKPDAAVDKEREAWSQNEEGDESHTIDLLQRRGVGEPTTDAGADQNEGAAGDGGGKAAASARDRAHGDRKRPEGGPGAPDGQARESWKGSKGGPAEQTTQRHKGSRRGVEKEKKAGADAGQDEAQKKPGQDGRGDTRRKGTTRRPPRGERSNEVPRHGGSFFGGLFGRAKRHLQGDAKEAPRQNGAAARPSVGQENATNSLDSGRDWSVKVIYSYEGASQSVEPEDWINLSQMLPPAVIREAAVDDRARYALVPPLSTLQRLVFEHFQGRPRVRLPAADPQTGNAAVAHAPSQEAEAQTRTAETAEASDPSKPTSELADGTTEAEARMRVRRLAAGSARGRETWKKVNRETDVSKKGGYYILRVSGLVIESFYVSGDYHVSPVPTLYPVSEPVTGLGPLVSYAEYGSQFIKAYRDFQPPFPSLSPFRKNSDFEAWLGQPTLSSWAGGDGGALSRPQQTQAVPLDVEIREAGQRGAGTAPQRRARPGNAGDVEGEPGQLEAVDGLAMLARAQRVNRDGEGKTEEEASEEKRSGLYSRFNPFVCCLNESSRQLSKWCVDSNLGIFAGSVDGPDAEGETEAAAAARSRAGWEERETGTSKGSDEAQAGGSVREDSKTPTAHAAHAVSEQTGQTSGQQLPQRREDRAALFPPSVGKRKVLMVYLGPRTGGLPLRYLAGSGGELRRLQLAQRSVETLVQNLDGFCTADISYKTRQDSGETRKRGKKAKQKKQAKPEQSPSTSCTALDSFIHARVGIREWRQLMALKHEAYVSNPAAWATSYDKRMLDKYQLYVETAFAPEAPPLFLPLTSFFQENFLLIRVQVATCPSRPRGVVEFAVPPVSVLERALYLVGYPAAGQAAVAAYGYATRTQSKLTRLKETAKAAAAEAFPQYQPVLSAMQTATTEAGLWGRASGAGDASNWIGHVTVKFGKTSTSSIELIDGSLRNRHSDSNDHELPVDRQQFWKVHVAEDKRQKGSNDDPFYVKGVQAGEGEAATECDTTANIVTRMGSYMETRVVPRLYASELRGRKIVLVLSTDQHAFLGERFFAGDRIEAAWKQAHLMPTRNHTAENRYAPRWTNNKEPAVGGIVGATATYNQREEASQKTDVPEMNLADEPLSESPATQQSTAEDEQAQLSERVVSQEEATVVPQEEETVVPGDEETVMPQEQETVVPQEQETVVPQEQETVVPGDEETVMPQEEETVVPEGEETVMPQEEETAMRQDDETVVPQEEETAMPEDEATVVPQEEARAMPQDDETVVPQEEETAMPEDEATVVPREEARAMPQEEARAMPQEEARVMPQEEARAMPQEEARAIPQEEARAMPQEEARAMPQEEARAMPQEEARAMPQEETVVPEDEEAVTPEDEEAVTPEDEEAVTPEDEEAVTPEDQETVVLEDEETATPQDE